MELDEYLDLYELGMSISGSETETETETFDETFGFHLVY